MMQIYRNLRPPSFLVLAICTTLSLSLMFTSRASAQTVTGSIYGTVADQSGALIPGATITVTNVSTNEEHATQSNGSGEYVFPVLSPGDYSISSTAAGFNRVVQKNIQLAANQNVNASFVMKAGAVQTTVTVQATSTLVDTREAVIGTTISQNLIVDLPLVGRSAYDLVSLVPGVTNYNPSTQIGDFNGTFFSTNGLPQNFNAFYLDGSYNTALMRSGGNIVPNPDALAEFRILTSNQDAEFGRFPGAVVNTITRSGTNQFHGVAYDFLRNVVLTAKNYFASSVTPLVYNVYGVGAGGPAIRNKFFFYLNYQGTRINTPAVTTSASLIVPSALERVGNFSQSAKKPTSTGCPTGTTPIAPATICIDPVAVAALKYVPLPINAANNPAQLSAPANTRADQGVARLDYQLNPAHKLWLTYFESQGTNLIPNTQNNQIFSFAGATNFATQSNYVLGDTWILSPHAVNSITAFYSRNHTIGGNTNSGGRLADLGSTIPEGSLQGLTTTPQFKISGYWTMGIINQGNTNQSQVQVGVTDVLNYTRGSHTAKFGGAVNLGLYQETAVSQGSTKDTFTGSATGNALADFMEGRINAFLQDTGYDLRLHGLDPSLFAQDDWRVTRRLTLDLGVRWEVFYPFSGQNNMGTFVPGVQSIRFPTAPLGLLSSGDPGVPDGVLRVAYDRFAPRVGFAADLLGNGRLALKGAYGIFYSIDSAVMSKLEEEEPFFLSVSLSKTSSLVNPYLGIAPYNGVSPFPYKLNPPAFVPGATLAAFKPYTAATPYVHEFNLALQQQIGDTWSVQAAYVGNLSRHFFMEQDENAPIYAAGASTSNASIQARRPYQPEGQIVEQNPIDNASYNSLQVSVTKRFTKGFSLLASYVWSKTLNIQDGDTLTLANESDPGMDYGLSQYHLPQAFVASYKYALPDVKRYGLVGKELLSGWQINGTTTLDKGGPFDILSNVDTNFDGIATDRPNVVGDPNLGSGRSRSQKISEFFNTAAYALPSAGQLYGNSRRNSLIGPGYIDTDLSAFKRFPIYEQSTLLLRVEMFNTFNNVNLGAPNGTYGNATFGQISSANSPRTVQVALKYEF